MRYLEVYVVLNVYIVFYAIVWITPVNLLTGIDGKQNPSHL